MIVPPEPWSIYVEKYPPVSSCGPLISHLLMFQVCLADGFGPEDIARAHIADGDVRSRVARSIRSAVELFRSPLMDGRFKTYSRPFGGGPLSEIPREHWEMDDHTVRFATSSYNPLQPFDQSAPPSAWIFADRSAEAAILDLHRKRHGIEVRTAKEDRSDAVAEKDVIAPPDSRKQEGRAFLRRKEVERLTGLAKSSIYERMAQDRFPRPETIGRGRAVGWRLEAIQQWLENPS